MKSSPLFWSCVLVLAFGSAVSLSRPGSLTGLGLPGSSTLGFGQRDVRIFNNFVDATANDNSTAQDEFPGALGAALAVWKGTVEWASGPWAGTGAGDPTQASLGDGGANFDSTWQGAAAAMEGSSSNIATTFPSDIGGVIAFTETGPGGISGGWRMRFVEQPWIWNDGPGAIPGTHMDIQGIATHQYGHALGLDHSTDPDATMAIFFVPGSVALRSIEADDIAAIQALYGVAAATKPLITGLDGSSDVGATLVIEGENFAVVGNDVWLTAEGGDGTPVVLTNVVATNGGTRIKVTVPAGVADGDVLVKLPSASLASLSNAFPFDAEAGALGAGFTVLGPGIGGAGGTPSLTGSGDLTPGSPDGFALDIAGCPPGAPGVLFLAVGGGGAVPFKQGTFYPVPILVQVGFSVNGAGAAFLPLAYDASVPSGFELSTQYWCLDATAPAGAAGTNGLSFETL